MTKAVTMTHLVAVTRTSRLTAIHGPLALGPPPGRGSGRPLSGPAAAAGASMPGHAARRLQVPEGDAANGQRPQRPASVGFRTAVHQPHLRLASGKGEARRSARA